MRVRTGSALLPALLLLSLCCPHMVLAQCGTPRIFCPGDITVTGCESGGAIVNYPIPTGENDCGVLATSLESGFLPGLFPFGTTPVRWRTASDANGIFTNCTFRVTVEQPHVNIHCPDDISVDTCDPDGTVVRYPQPTAESECGPVFTSLQQGPLSGSVFPFGTTIVKWRTRPDSHGTFNDCLFQVTVEDPRVTIHCPDDITAYTCGPGGVAVDYPQPTAENECGRVDTFLMSGPLSGSVFPIGTTLVKWQTAPDQNNGTFYTCMFSVTVLLGDVIPPTITCPEDFEVIAQPGQTTAVVHYSVKTSDNCPGIVVVQCTPPSGSVFSCGTTRVTCTATDAATNQSTCTFAVTVATPVAVDFRPGGCPNPLKTSEQGLIPVAIMGTSFFDPAQVDPATVRLEGIAPLRWDREDVGAPYFPFVGKVGCLDCNTLKKDRIQDMTFKFSAPDLVAALGTLTQGECRVVHLRGNRRDGCPIVGEDVVRIQILGGQLEPVSEPAAPEAYALHANHPNPFGFKTQISYDLSAPGLARLTVYDVLGREVKLMVDGVLPAGRYEDEWDGTDLNGSPVASGAYFYVLSVDPVDGGEGFREIRKLIVSR